MRPLTLPSVLLFLAAAVEAPQPLPATRHSDALSLAWRPDPRSVAHELEVGRVETVPPRYEIRRLLDFSSLTNTSGNTRDLSRLSPPESWADVGGTNLCLQALAGGHLQVGKSKRIGELLLPLEKAEARTALMTLFRHPADNDGKVSVGCLLDGGPKAGLSSPVLTVRPTQLAVPLPDEAQTLVLRSRTTRRIRVRDIAVVTDYEAGHAVTNAVACRRRRTCDCTVKNLAPGDYVWRVRSFDAEGTPSAWSAPLLETLAPEDGRRPVPGLKLLIR